MGNVDSRDSRDNKQKKGQKGSGDKGKFLKDIHLTDTDFEIKNGRVYLKTKGDTGFVAFYAPWCHFCTDLAPNWNKYAKQMKESSFHFLAVDCTSGNSNVVSSALNIRGYPTIKYIKPKTGEIIAAEYKDGSNIQRTPEGFKQFLKEQGVM
jgi:thiol-disulfide isomerase/thioredoxin